MQRHGEGVAVGRQRQHEKAGKRGLVLAGGDDELGVVARAGCGDRRVRGVEDRDAVRAARLGRGVAGQIGDRLGRVGRGDRRVLDGEQGGYAVDVRAADEPDHRHGAGDARRELGGRPQRVHAVAHRHAAAAVEVADEVGARARELGGGAQDEHAVGDAHVAVAVGVGAEPGRGDVVARDGERVGDGGTADDEVPVSLHRERNGAAARGRDDAAVPEARIERSVGVVAGDHEGGDAVDRAVAGDDVAAVRLACQRAARAERRRHAPAAAERRVERAVGGVAGERELERLARERRARDDQTAIGVADDGVGLVVRAEARRDHAVVAELRIARAVGEIPHDGERVGAARAELRRADDHHRAVRLDQQRVRRVGAAGDVGRHEPAVPEPGVERAAREVARHREVTGAVALARARDDDAARRVDDDRRGTIVAAADRRGDAAAGPEVGIERPVGAIAVERHLAIAGGGFGRRAGGDEAAVRRRREARDGILERTERADDAAAAERRVGRAVARVADEGDVEIVGIETRAGGARGDDGAVGQQEEAAELVRDAADRRDRDAAVPEARVEIAGGGEPWCRAKYGRHEADGPHDRATARPRFPPFHDHLRPASDGIVVAPRRSTAIRRLNLRPVASKREGPPPERGAFACDKTKQNARRC